MACCSRILPAGIKTHGYSFIYPFLGLSVPLAIMVHHRTTTKQRGSPRSELYRVRVPRCLINADSSISEEYFFGRIILLRQSGVYAS